MAELVRRGHRVTYAVAADRAGAVTAAGAQVLRCRSVLRRESSPGLTGPAQPDLGGHLGVVLNRLLAEAEAMMPQFERRLLANRPDVVAYDVMAAAGRLFALKHALPTVQLQPILATNQHWSAGRSAHRFDPDHPAYLTYLARLGTFLRRHEVALTPAEFRAFTADRYLAFYPRRFQYRAETFDERYHFVGPCVRPPEPAAWRPPEGPPVVLVSLGTVYNDKPDFYRTCIEAFAGSPWHAVLAVGQRVDLAALGPVPGNVEVHPVVPQLDVLGRARAFVNHAGMGGVMEALLAGVPQVVLPQTAEQAANAAQVVRLGIGEQLIADVDATGLRAAVERVAADIGMAERIRRLRAEALAAGGVTRAADVIETCAQLVRSTHEA